jgi:hypothetical protein
MREGADFNRGRERQGRSAALRALPVAIGDLDRGWRAERRVPASTCRVTISIRRRLAGLAARREHGAESPGASDKASG